MPTPTTAQAAVRELADLETMLFELPEPGIGRLLLNRPKRRNSQTRIMFAEYGRVGLVLRDVPLRALVVAGAGGRFFCPGYDLAQISEIADLRPLEFLRFQEIASSGVQSLHFLPFPVIAAINGPAVGGGLALACAADIRLAGQDAVFGAGFIKVGLSAGELGLSYHLTRLLGPGRAAEFVYTGRIMDAAEAMSLGLVNAVVDDPMTAALEMAQQIAANSPAGVRMSKRALQRNGEITSYAAALELENRGQALLTRTADMPEALAAFLDQRPPEFRGQ